MIGTLDRGFVGNSSLKGSTAIAFQNDGKVLITGSFTNSGDLLRNRVVRLNSDGNVDVLFDPGMGFNNTTRSVVVQADGKALVAGDFTNYNGTPRTRVARLNMDGSLDPTLDPGAGPNARINALLLLGDGSIMIAGAFTNFAGVDRRRVTKLKNDLRAPPFMTALSSNQSTVVGRSVTFFANAGGTGPLVVPMAPEWAGYTAGDQRSAALAKRPTDQRRLLLGFGHKQPEFSDQHRHRAQRFPGSRQLWFGRCEYVLRTGDRRLGEGHHHPTKWKGNHRGRFPTSKRNRQEARGSTQCRRQRRYRFRSGFRTE
jgi:uncharacterized delta-60 repeat protein